MVELLTVLKELTLKLCNASPRPGNDDFTGWLPVGWSASAFDLLLLSRPWALCEGSGGPATDHTSTRYSHRYRSLVQLLHLLHRR